MNRKFLALALTFGVLASTTALAANFRDTNGHWASPAIDNLVERGVMAGYTNNTFRPYKNVTRAEFAQLLVRSMDDSQAHATRSGSVSFTDLPQDHWAFPAIQEAAQLGLMEGYNNGQFRPDRFITRGEALTVLAKITVGENPTTEETQKLLSRFNDARRLPEWMREPVAKEIGYKIYRQSRYINPNQRLTRGEMASLLNNMINHNDLALTPKTEVYHEYQATNPNQRVKFQAPAQVSELKPTFTTTTTQAISSEYSRLGDEVTLVLNDPLKTADGTIAPAGSRVQGRISEVQKASNNFPGRVIVQFNSVLTPQGRSLAVRGTMDTRDGYLAPQVPSGHKQAYSAGQTFSLTRNDEAAQRQSFLDSNNRVNVGAGQKLEVKFHNVAHVYGNTNSSN